MAMRCRLLCLMSPLPRCCGLLSIFHSSLAILNAVSRLMHSTIPPRPVLLDLITAPVLNAARLSIKPRELVPSITVKWLTVITCCKASPLRTVRFDFLWTKHLAIPRSVAAKAMNSPLAGQCPQVCATLRFAGVGVGLPICWRSFGITDSVG